MKTSMYLNLKKESAGRSAAAELNEKDPVYGGGTLLWTSCPLKRMSWDSFSLLAPAEPWVDTSTGVFGGLRSYSVT